MSAATNVCISAVIAITAGSAVAASVESAAGIFSATLPIDSSTRPSVSRRLRCADFMSPGTLKPSARVVCPFARWRSWLICAPTSTDDVPPVVSAAKNSSVLESDSWTRLATSRL